MGAKKGAKKKKKKSDDESVGPDKDPAALLAAYVKTCQSIGLPPPPNDCIVSSLKDTDTENYGKQILINGTNDDDDESLLGPGRCRALAVAISGRGHDLPLTEAVEPIVFSELTDIRIWKSRIGDDGAVALADMLRLGGQYLNVSFLELLDSKIEARGAYALGRSLSCAMNTTLTTLNLDYNANLKSEGIIALCQGLRTNSTLKHLSANYCNIDSPGADMIGEMLSFKRSALTSLRLAGNRLGGKGLMGLCQGLSQNSTLEELNLADNNIRATEEDTSGLEAFGRAIATHSSLIAIDLLHNSIGNDGGRALVPCVCKNKKLDSFKVDPTSVSDKELYGALFRIPLKGKGKKKKGKSKKKK